MSATMHQDRERHMKAHGMVDVTWNGTSGPRPESQPIEFSLATRCGAILRYRISREDTKHLQATLAEALTGVLQE